MQEFDYKRLVNRRYLVKRQLKIDPVNTQTKDNILRDINSLIGVDLVSIDTSGRQMRLSYDASKRQLRDFEAVLILHDCSFEKHRWQAIKAEWYRIKDSSIYKGALQASTNVREVNI